MREAQSLPCYWRRVSAIAETPTLFEGIVPVKPVNPLPQSQFKEAISHAARKEHGKRL